MLAGMRVEFRGGPAAADLSRYLESAVDSIGVEMIAFTAFVAMDPPGTRTMGASLRRAERSFSTAVRLANDLRTCERELRSLQRSGQRAGRRMDGSGRLAPPPRRQGLVRETKLRFRWSERATPASRRGRSGFGA